MAVSRILSGAPLARRPGRPFVSAPSFGGHWPLRAATNTRGPRRLRAGRAGGPRSPVLSCTTRGFSCPLACARGGGLLPRHFNLAVRLAPSWAVCFLRHCPSAGAWARSLPRVLRGVLPCGVRTFLPPQAEGGRPPSGKKLSRFRMPSNREFAAGAGIFKRAGATRAA